MAEGEFKIRSRKLKGKPERILSLEGNIGISQIMALKESILKQMPAEGKCTIEIKNAYKMDISTIQLLLSLLKTLRKKKVTAVLQADMRKDQLTFIHNAGFAGFIKN